MARRGIDSLVGEVSLKSEQIANIITVKNILSDDLIDHPNNNEDVTNTIDLVTSIKEQGFTTPIEVTDYGMEQGKYMIISGHRRRAAGVEAGLKQFPCIVRHYDNANDVYNAVLMGNSYRDSGKDDPLLLFYRYEGHKKYLIDIGFKGSKKDEIARRMGIGPAMIDRYAALSKIKIPAVLDLIRAEKIGLSSVQKMATLDEPQQKIVFDWFELYLESNDTITRTVANQLISGCKEGLDYISAINDTTKNNSKDEIAGLDYPNNNFEFKPIDRNDEIEREYEDSEDKTPDTKPKSDKKKDENIEYGLELVKLTEKIGRFSDKVVKYDSIIDTKNAIMTFGSCCIELIEIMQTLERDETEDDFKRELTEISNVINAMI